MQFFSFNFDIFSLSFNGIIKIEFISNGFFLGKMLAIFDSTSGSDMIRAYVLRGVFDVF